MLGYFTAVFGKGTGVGTPLERPGSVASLGKRFLVGVEVRYRLNRMGVGVFDREKPSAISTA